MTNSIKDLITYLSDQYNPKQIGKLTQSLSPKQAQLFQLIRSHPLKEDHFYQNAIYSPSQDSGAYQKLCQRLFKSLIHHFFIHRESLERDDLDKYRALTYEYTAVAGMLMMTNCYEALRTVIKEAKYFAQQSHATDQMLLLLKYQLEIFGPKEQNLKKFDKLYSEYHACEKQLHTESKLQFTYFRLYAMTQSKNEITGISDVDIEFWKEVISQDLSFRSVIFAYRLLCLWHEVNFNYDELLTIAQEGKEYFKHNADNSSLFVRYFNRSIFVALIHLKQIDKLRVLIHEMLEATVPYSNTWLVIKLYHVILLLHQRDYDSAFHSVEDIPTKKLIVSANSLEFYKIVQAYCYFISSWNNDKPIDVKRFRIYKLLNELPIQSKDKSRMNIALIVLQILYLIEKGDFDAIVDKNEALAQYSRRFLKEEHVARSRYFIKLLRGLPKGRFHPHLVQTYNKEAWRHLQKYPIELSTQPVELEIVPYEDLYQMILRRLEAFIK